MLKMWNYKTGSSIVTKNISIATPDIITYKIDLLSDLEDKQNLLCSYRISGQTKLRVIQTSDLGFKNC